MQKFTGYFDERAVPRIYPTKLYPRLNKRDHVHFDASDATITALFQKFRAVVKWTCAASVARSEVDQAVSKLRLSDVPPSFER